MNSAVRKELVRTANEHLANVIGASGKAEELVRLTTEIVKAARSLCQGTPEATQQNSTVILSAFVKAAKAIAQDPRSVDSSSLQQLSASKKAVETLVCELDEWHSTQAEDEGHAALKRLCSDGQADAVPTEQEKKLADELRRQQVTLLKKKEPQAGPPSHGKPEEVLGIAIQGLEASSQELVKVAEEKSPARKSLFEPMLTIVKMVNMLLDVVDSLFVSRFPMRSQVHSFCCTLLEGVLSYKEKTKTDDISILRVLQTQPSAMLTAIGVMSEQCQSRLQDLEMNLNKSILRRQDLDNDLGKPPSPQPKSTARPPPPQPPGQTKRVEEPPKKKEFEIYCILSTNVAVDPKTNQQIPKGTEVAIKVTSDTSILDVKKELAVRTGLPINQIQVKYRGDDALADSNKVNNNPVPYFMFNEFEPSEELLQEWKKELRKKNKVKLEDIDWTQFKSTVGIALFDNELFEEGGDWLSFDEGDVIEVIETTPDGWCEGILNGKKGTFPASFVLEVQPPRTKDELKQLIKMVNLKKKAPDADLDTVIGDDGASKKLVGRNSPQPKSKADASQGEAISHGPAPRLMDDRRASEQLLEQSPQFRPKMNMKRKGEGDRRTSEPVLPLADQPKEGKLKKVVKDLLKRNTQGAPWDEESGDRGIEGGLKPRSPILSGRAASSSQPSEEEDGKTQSAPETGRKVAPLRPPEPAAARLSPQIPIKGVPSPQSKSKRPPPPPPPFSVTHGSKSVSEEKVKSPIPVIVTGEEGGGVRDVLASGDQSLLAPPAGSIKSSSSMEQLFENLREFDEATENEDPILRPKPGPNSAPVDYASIPEAERPVLVPKYESQPERDEDESSPSPEPPIPVRSNSISKPTSVPVRSGSISGSSIARSGSGSGSSVPAPYNALNDTPPPPSLDDAPPPHPPERHNKPKALPLQSAIKGDSSGDETSQLSPVQTTSQAKSSSAKPLPSQPAMQKQPSVNKFASLSSASEQAPPTLPERPIPPSKSISKTTLSQPPATAATKQNSIEAPPLQSEQPPLLLSKQMSKPLVSGIVKQESQADETPPVLPERSVPPERPIPPSKSISKLLPSQPPPPASTAPKQDVLSQETAAENAAVPPKLAPKSLSLTTVASKQNGPGSEAPPRPLDRPALPAKPAPKPAPPPPASSTSKQEGSGNEAIKPARLLVKPIFKPPPPPNGPPPTSNEQPKILVTRQTAPELPQVQIQSQSQIQIQNQTKAPALTKPVYNGDSSTAADTRAKSPPPAAPPRKKKAGKTLEPEPNAAAPELTPLRAGAAKVKRNASFSPSSSRTQSPDEPKIQDYLGSPVVMRRTKAVVGEGNSRQQVVSDDMDECTGVGKEGVLYKEAAGNAEWKARYFQLLSDKLIYYESDTLPQDDKQLGEVPGHRMQRAVPLEEREGYHCFAINMKYETSIVLASTRSPDMEDWIRSINKMIGAARLKNPKQMELLWYNCASKCLDYILEDKRLEEVRVLLSSVGNQAVVSKWLSHLEKGEEPDLSCIPDTTTAVAFLRCILKDKLPGCLLSQERAKELCDMMKSASPLSTLAARLQELADEPRALLKQMLNMFGQALEYCDINKTAIGDLNHCFGPLIFEKLPTSQSEPLLAYLISTRELVLG